MKVLISAYACEPGKGSEPEVGLRVVLAAARAHDVWVITRSNNVPSLRDFFAGHVFEDRVHFEGVDLSPRARTIKRIAGLAGMHWYYARWQRAAERRARELDREIGFDVVHHATFASYWTPAGVASLGRPFIWGPVGGGVDVPLPLLREVGLRGAALEIMRVLSRFGAQLRPSFRRRQRAASHVFAQNRETARRLKRCTSISVLPNAVAVKVDPPPGGSRRRELAFVGRLVGWKAARLAVRILTLVDDQDVVLRIYGDGPDRPRVERAARKYSVADRVVFVGRRAREQLLVEVATAGAVVHPALREEAGWSVSEALALGTPVVCLDHGGPAELCRIWSRTPSRLVKPGSPQVTIHEMARAVEQLLRDPAPVGEEVVPPDDSFAEAILAAYARTTDTNGLE